MRNESYLAQKQKAALMAAKEITMKRILLYVAAIIILAYSISPVIDSMAEAGINALRAEKARLLQMQ